MSTKAKGESAGFETVPNFSNNSQLPRSPDGVTQKKEDNEVILKDIIILPLSQYPNNVSTKAKKVPAGFETVPNFSSSSQLPRSPDDATQKTENNHVIMKTKILLYPT